MTRPSLGKFGCSIAKEYYTLLGVLAIDDVNYNSNLTPVACSEMSHSLAATSLSLA